MIESWNLTIPELTGNEPRRAYVYLPDAWDEDHDQRYPVLYMFDGHNVFFDDATSQHENEPAGASRTGSDDQS